MSNKINATIFYFFLFTLPWQTIFILREIGAGNEKFQYGTIGIYFFEILLFFWILINLPVFKKYSHKKLLFSVSIFIIYSCLSVFWATDKILSLYTLLPIMLGGFSFLILQKKLLNFKLFAFIFIFSVSIQGIFGINQFFEQTIASNKWLGISQHLAWQGGASVIETSTERFLRAYGGMSHPNILGGFLMIAILLAIGAYLKASLGENYWRYFLLISFLINFFALLVSFSRSAMFALAFGLFLFFAYYIYNQRTVQTKKLLFFIVLFAIISFIFFNSFSNLLITRLNSTSRLEQKSLNERIIFMREAQLTIAQQPILGTGLGNYTLNLVKNNPRSKNIWEFQPVHNTYLLIFAELGILGFSLFLFIVLYIIYGFFESFSKENTNRVIFSTIIISLLVLSFFDHWLWSTHSGIIIFWLLLSFSIEKTTDLA